MADEEIRKTLEATFQAAWNHGDFSLVDQYVDPDIVDHFDHNQGVENFKDVIKMFRGGFPDVHLTIDESLAEKDKYVHQWTMTGTHQGELFGIPPTGKAMTWTGITIVRVADGKIVERWANVDVLSILQQMGVVPGPPG